MIRLDHDQAGKELTKRVNGNPAYRDAHNQQAETDWTDDIRGGANTTDAEQAQNHSYQLKSVGEIPKLRGMLVRILSWLDSITPQIWILDQEPHQANDRCQDRN